MKWIAKRESVLAAALLGALLCACLVLSGVATQETVQACAYQPTMVLDGVGSIARLAEAAE